MSQSTPPTSTQSTVTPTDTTATVPPTKSPGRRTLQSGFSLLARGEPKIWLTGGMLVICLTMVVSLLSLIVINGLATFWPGPVDWLVLNDQQFDIGEPQRTEIRPATSSSAGEPTSGTSSSAEPASATLQPSRFYRTANFDITNRHYRWFEPTELSASGILRPEWALVIERLSWGRMLALPSRLSQPIRYDENDQELVGLQTTQSLSTELSADLETLAATEPVIPLASITQAIQSRIDAVKTKLMKTAITKSLGTKLGTPQWQATESEPWQVIESALPADTNVVAARVVWDEPTAILENIAPVLQQLAKTRGTVTRAMHSISLLDRELAEARVAVRQAELDTGRTALEKVDAVGPIIDGLVANERMHTRIEQQRMTIALADAEQKTQWQSLLARYSEQTVKPANEAFKAELSAWEAQFAQEPARLQQAVQAFATTWRSVLERKLPLEEAIQSAEASMAGYELQVLVPTDALPLELPPADSDQLLEGTWTDIAKEQLATLSIVPSAAKPVIQQLTKEISVVQLDDTTRGRLMLWCIQSAAKPAVWRVPPQRAVNCSEIVRLFPANRLGIAGKLNVYGARWHEFLLDDPREANTEGGVFPAIWGTIVMTLIMTLVVVPFGVVAALYLREYTRSGPLVSLVRISINNLAGVPSIVYGVFGLAFFCYSIGAFIDGGPKNAQFGIMPTNGWYALLGGTVLIGVVAFMFSLMGSGPAHSQTKLQQRLARIAPMIWFLSLVCAATLIFKSPFFDGFYQARLPAPTFGKEGLLWASFTLAILTLPVVIVATEEALSAVPNSLREGSLACGASKWQTIYRIVLPHARPGILTGAILAMARGIGEVAPLMLVGALPVAPDLPLDSEFPFFHGSRSFMHLGYQIYWLGFQSQNSEASKPLVFTCTLLLILIVISLNLTAILLRARLRRRFQGNQF